MRQAAYYKHYLIVEKQTQEVDSVGQYVETMYPEDVIWARIIPAGSTISNEAGQKKTYRNAYIHTRGLTDINSKDELVELNGTRWIIQSKDVDDENKELVLDCISLEFGEDED